MYYLRITMYFYIKKLAVSLLILLTVNSVNAHHSFAVEFTAEKTIAINGVVTEIWFRNPHVRYYIDIINEDYETESWDVRTSSPSLLVRKGWTKKTIQVGDEISIFGHPGRDNRKLLSVISIKLPDGSSLGKKYPESDKLGEK